MINETLIVEMKNFSTLNNTFDCGTLQYNLQDKVDTTFKVLLFVLPAMMIFKWWAIGKILDSGETMDRKKFLISFAELFINGVSLILFFYMIYFVFMSSIDF
jgi:hypothetical protein